MVTRFGWKQASGRLALACILFSSISWLLCTLAASLAGFGGVESTLFGNLGGILAVALCDMVYGKQSLSYVGGGLDLVSYGVAMVFVWVSCQGLSGFLYHTLGSSGWEHVQAEATGAPAALVLLWYLVSAPVLEELLVRHLFYGMAANAFPMLDGLLAIATSVLFGGMHGNIAQGFPGVVCGMLFCYAYRQFGLLGSIWCHFLFNLYSILFPMAYPDAYAGLSSGGWIGGFYFLAGMVAVFWILHVSPARGHIAGTRLGPLDYQPDIRLEDAEDMFF